MPGFAEITVNGVSCPSQKSFDNADIQPVDFIQLVEPFLISFLTCRIAGALARDRFHVTGRHQPDHGVYHKGTRDYDQDPREDSFD